MAAEAIRSVLDRTLPRMAGQASPMTHRDPVTPELYRAVLLRDKGCVLAKIDPEHYCRDEWGYPHAATNLAKLTIEHVKDQPRMGRRAPSDMAHCLALYAGANIGVPSKGQREAMRAYLRAAEG